MDRPLFIAGATGLTGRAAVADARSRGLAVIAHVRPDSSRLEEHRARFEALGATVDVTPWEEAAMTEALRAAAPRALLALLGTTRKRARQAAKAGRDPAAESYEAVDYGLTALLRRAGEGCGHRPRFVYLGAVGAKEGTRNPYMAVRVRIERELREGELPWVVARPSFILGDRDETRPGESVGAALVDGALAFVGAVGGRALRERYASMRGEELGAAMVTLAVGDGFEGRCVEPAELRRLADAALRRG